MLLTLDMLLNEPSIVRAVIDRTAAMEENPTWWKKYLKFEQTNMRIFPTFMGTQTGVRMGSVISKDGRKPIRERHSLGKGYGEVATLGDRYQIDNARLDMLRAMINRFNATNGGNLEEIIDYLMTDFREAVFAPHVRMNKVLGDLLSTGKAFVEVDSNPQGVDGIDINLPFVKKNATASAKGKMLPFLQDLVAKNRKLGRFSTMLMSRKTYTEKFALTEEFTSQFKQSFGSSEITTKGGVMTENMANAIFTSFGLPEVRIEDEFVENPDGDSVQVFADDKIAFIQSDKLGKMKWYTPYEITDKVPNKVYVETGEGGMFISTQRTEEGRFLEYGCEWIPEIANPNKILLLDVSKVK